MNLKKKHIILVGGARPNFMKITPLYLELKKRGAKVTLVNAGQHFDAEMSGDFFREFGVKPDVVLQPSRNTEHEQFSDMLMGLGKEYARLQPDLAIVVGDTNTTLAAALAARLQDIPVAHVEAGLRSFNRVMREERNRILVDSMSQFLFITEKSARENIRAERLTGKVFLVGNVMMDMIRLFPPKPLGISEPFFFATLHRPENVDDQKIFGDILDALEVIARDAPIYLPLHPRTKKRAEEFGYGKRLSEIFRLLSPLGYAATIAYEKEAELVLTDSGGLQEETTFLGTPCITLREETERPITVEKGTNMIGGITKTSILRAYKKPRRAKKRVIPLWDGKTAGRIADTLEKL
jgi:UDP-N-acetylglucosamine 2-epimerase (non-hydrolysing)